MKIHHKDNYYLEVEAKHTDLRQKGILVTVTKIELDGMFTKFEPFEKCNFNLLVHKYKRKNQKKIDKMNDLIKENINEIYNLWLNNNEVTANKIFELAKEL